VKRFVSALAATVLLTTGSLALAGNSALKFPGIGELWNNTGVNVQATQEHRVAVQEFARELTKWWNAENEPKPEPYLRYKGKRIKIPAKFLKAYQKANNENKLRIAWNTIERDLQVIQATVICCG